MVLEMLVVASFYHAKFDGRMTASGEIYRHHALTCAHRTKPFGARVLFKRGKRSVILRVNDRGPFVHGRDYDLSGAAAAWLRMDGVHRLRATPLPHKKVNPQLD